MFRAPHWLIAVLAMFAACLAACNAADTAPNDDEPSNGAGAIGGKSPIPHAGTGGTSAGSGSGSQCTPCGIETIKWGSNGGFVAFNEQSRLESCDTYRHTRTMSGSSMPSLQCERPVPCTGSGLHGFTDVLNQLADPEVQASVKQRAVLFGLDTRPSDGTTFEIETSDFIIDIGSDCDMSASCTPTPNGVKQLRDMLQAIDEEQLGIEPCVGMFD